MGILNRQKSKLLAGYLLFLTLITCTISFGQKLKINKTDSIKVEFYELNDSLNNNRIYVSQKLTSPAIINKDGSHTLRYRSNGNTNIGIGTTYKWLTINLAGNFGFINDDDDIKGRTRHLDFQSRGFGRSFIIDFFAQFYKGVYLLPDTGKIPQGQPFPQRGDIYTQQIGAAFYYYPNWRKFSTSAAAIQRDWQKKSAGSLIYGGEFFTGKIRGDSNLIPNDRAAYFDNGQVDRIVFFEIAAGGGYAYTLVVNKRWFASVTGIVSLSAGILRESFEGNPQRNIYLRPNYLIRPSIGYNSKRWNGSVMLFGSRVNAGNNNRRYEIETFNLRFTLAYRLLPRNRHNKVLNDVLNLNPFWRDRK
jgi:hypothetical protein